MGREITQMIGRKKNKSLFCTDVIVPAQERQDHIRVVDILIFDLEQCETNYYLKIFGILRKMKIKLPWAQCWKSSLTSQSQQPVRMDLKL